MIEFGSITGVIEDGLVQVKIRTGEHLFAPLTVVGNNVTIPSDEWIKDNKNKFLALVSYEKDIWNSPMIIGFYPINGYSVEDNPLYKTIELLKDVIDILEKAKVLTLMGPQLFTPETLTKLEALDKNYTEILKMIRK